MSKASQISELIPERRPLDGMEVPSSDRPGHLRIASDRPEPNLPKDLLLKLLTPPADARLRDRQFLAIRQQLLDQFRPTEPAQLLDVDLIASDLLQLASHRQAMDGLISVNLPADVSRRARKAQDHKRLVELMRWLIERGQDSKLFDCDEEEAGVLAPRLMEIFDNLKQLVAEADAEMEEMLAEKKSVSPGKSDEPMEESDEEDPRRRQLLQIILPLEAMLADRPKTQEVLMGNQPLSPDQNVRWVALLMFAAENAANAEFRLNEAITRAEAAEREVLAALARDPLKLAILHRCACEVEEAIQVRLRRLKAAR